MDKPDLIADVTNSKNGLTEKEEFFLDVLFDAYKGNVRAAMDAAGYPKGMATRVVTTKLHQHIVEASKAYLAANSAKASIAVVGVLDDPSQMGANTTLKAAKELLDRTGVQEEEKATKVIERNIFILPAKEGYDE